MLAIDKPPHVGVEALLERVRKRVGYEQASALSSWGEGVSGVCWIEKVKGASSRASDHELWVVCRGNLRKQGTIARGAAPGSRYRKQADVARHSLAAVLTKDNDERRMLRDFVGIRHPILGDVDSGDVASNEFLLHRHGLDRPFVHVRSSRLRAASGEELEASSELAPDLARVQESLSSD